MPSPYLPPSLRHFQPRRLIAGPGSRFVALEYDLVAALRPGLLVDAGAGDAVSFFTYCQSMDDHDVDGTAYAVEDWDARESPHPEAAFEAIQAHGRGYYPGIYYVMRTPPGPASFHFGEGTIDFLRLDGPRFTARAELDSWLARVKPGGLVAFSGVNADAARPAWERVASLGRACIFPDGLGLGLCLLRGGDETELPELLRLALVDGELPQLIALYDHAREHHRLRHAMGKLLAG